MTPPNHDGSETPKCDAEQKWLFSVNGQMQTVCVHVEFARSLEKALNEANAKLATYAREDEVVPERFHGLDTMLQIVEAQEAEIVELQKDKDSCILFLQELGLSCNNLDYAKQINTFLEKVCSKP
jgi:hypothetical protein